MEGRGSSETAIDTNLLLQGLKILAKLQSSGPVAIVKPTLSEADSKGRDSNALLKPKETRKRPHDDSPTELDKKAKR